MHLFAGAHAARTDDAAASENARREKRGGDWQRVDFEGLDVTTSVSPDQLVALDDALVRLAALDPLAANVYADYLEDHGEPAAAAKLLVAFPLGPPAAGGAAC